MRLRKTARLGAVIAVACALPVGSAQAAAPDNIATAIIEQDGGEAFDFAWDVSRQYGGVVDQLNSAEAAARCTGCSATAIAFQVLIVSGAPSSVAPINKAVALNQGCTECVAVAEARQFVRVTEAPARLTAAGRAVLRDVRMNLDVLEEQDLPVDQLHQVVERQEARVREVLNTEMVTKADPTEEADVVDGWTTQDAELG
jgi:putative peptide zinc metalloprotease protein